MSGSFKILKEETRILGLDNCNPQVSIGAIVRGGLYLDGIVSIASKLDSEDVAREIKDTKYFPEMRLIMIHDSKRQWNRHIIHRVTTLPVIEVRSNGSIQPRAGLERKNSRRRWDATGLDRTMLAKIRVLTQMRNNLPEPVRIAHLLAKLHIFGNPLSDKG